MIMSRLTKRLTLVLLLVFTGVTAFAQDTVNIRSILLDSLVVKGNRYSSPIKETGDGAILWDMGKMDDLPKILGNADPVHYTQMLPGIGTNAEYQSGIHVQGCDNSHNYVSVNGVPIYNVNHLLGFFSIFNASHFSTLNIRKSLSAVSSPNRLGGGLDMQSGEVIPEKTAGELAVGLISSQGTIKIPLNMKTALTLSLRGAYINLLYGKWLKADDNQVEYSFSDCNLTLVHTFDKRNSLIFDFYAGNDNGGYGEASYLSDTKAVWGNVMGAVHWNYNGGQLSTGHSLYVTNYHNKFELLMQELQYRLPSNITDVGYKGFVRIGGWNFGADVILHSIQPQSLEVENSFNVSMGMTPRQHSLETSAFADYTLMLCRNLSMKIGARGSIYTISDTKFGSVDPSFMIQYGNSNVMFSASYYLRHQYLFQTGFSNAGLPTEFWMSSNGKHRPQYAHGCNLSASTYLPGRRFRLSVEMFFKRLYHQVEYQGNILDFVNTEYNIDNSLIHGNGNNCGFSVMLNKCAGRLQGWVAYSYTRARRQFEELGTGSKYSASHERPHEINSIFTYNTPGHWSYGANLVFASGTPFTAPTSIEFINGNVVSQYGSYNGNRLKPYFRIDVSVNYKWKNRRGNEHGLNLSLYNVTCRSNDIFYRVKFRKDKFFAYRPLSFVLPILPSISYFCKF